MNMKKPNGSRPPRSAALALATTLCLALLCLALAACGGASDDEDATRPSLFRFGTEAGQVPSEAPFPNDLYLTGAGGTIQVGSLAADPAFTGWAKPEVLASWDAYVAERTGWGILSTVWFPVTEGPDMASLEGRVTMVAIGGREDGRDVPVRVFYNADFGAVGVFPEWGHHLVGGTTYAVLIHQGVTDSRGDLIAPPEAFTASLEADSGPYADLAKWLQSSGHALEPADLVVATVFTTEDVLPFGRTWMAAVDAFVLEPPTRAVRWDAAGGAFVEAAIVEPEGLDAYFGVPEAPFDLNPGLWGSATRDRAADIAGYGKRYEGGTGHFDIGRVLNGSIVAPAFGFSDQAGEPRNVRLNPDSSLKAMIPFTLYLCADHAADPKKVPIAIFNHGGGALRTDALAYANANCQAGVATIALDMIFHGGRRQLALLADKKLIVPSEADTHNVFSGKSEGEAGYVPDHIGDPAGAAASVGPMYGLADAIDPMIVEGNLFTVTLDTYTLIRYLKEGDWSQVADGLSFDVSRLFHNSLSFGTCFTTALHALSDDISGIVSSAGSGGILAPTVTMGPVNAGQASGLLFVSLGLKTPPLEIQAGAWTDPVLSIHQWLHQRGDPVSWAPHVLRFRDSPRPAYVTSTSSWDETLYHPAQLTFISALGVQSFTGGGEWTLDPTVPGAETIAAASPPSGGISLNASFDSETTTAVVFHRDKACHAMVVTSLCTESFVHPYPPITELEVPVASDSPICALHGQVIGFVQSILDGGPAVVHAPSQTCAEVYGP